MSGWRIVVEPNGWTIEQPEDTHGLGGWAFYDDLPIESVWMAYSEPECVLEELVDDF